MTQQTFLAKAVYDNIAESPDEIAFRRGDVVTVLEQDTNGLDGWWLCTLRGKTGIAPGNRLKLLSGMLDTPGNTSIYRSPSSANSREAPHNKIVTPKKYEQNTQDYDVPPLRNCHNSEPDLQANYDTPPSSKMGCKSPNREMNLSLNSNLSFYDTPPSVKSTPGMNEDTYDVPPSQRDLSLAGPYNIQPSSKRSSVLSNLSVLSNESNMTVSSSTSYQSLSGISNAPSFSDSARSSMDISPQDLYDVPPSQKAYKQASSDSGLEVYDTPPKAKPSTPDIFLEDYDIPKKQSEYSYPSQTEYAYPAKPPDYSYPQHPIEHAYEEPKGSKEHDIDDLYDVPKNNAPVRSLSSTLADLPPKRELTNHGVYDIPPQVTRDSFISSKSDSSDSIDGQRLSTCSLDSRNSDIPIYDELRLDLDAAKDLVVKLQQDVQKSTNKLCSFVSSTWRNRENLECKMYEIKLACTSMKTAFDEFLDFSLGTLANSAKLPDKKLINKLHRQLDPLQKTLGQIKGCMKNLDLIKWQTSILVSEDSLKNDELGQLIAMAKDIPADVRRLTSVIQGNASLLFKRSHDNDTLTRNSDKTAMNSSKPTLKTTPTLTQQSHEKLNGVQQRPLPAPPASDRPLPPTPTEVKTQTFISKTDPKRLSIEIKRFSSDSNYSNDLCQLKRLSLDSQPEKDTDNSNWAQEYDYVQLEARDIDEQKKNLEEIMKDIPMKDTDVDLEPITPKNFEPELDSDSDLKTPVNKTFSISEKWDSTGIHLDGNDRQVLVFYSEQIETHISLLTNAVDAFYKCIECGEGPKVFISNSKFVVISAHKLVYIGDSLHRSLINNEVRNQIILCASVLCESLKKTITATKTAALQYPSVPAVQEMMDKISSVSHASHELKLVISHASSL